MKHIRQDRIDEIAVLTIDRPKINALNHDVLADLATHLSSMENDEDVWAVMLGGEGSFFSFGFDIGEILGYEKKEFLGFVLSFRDLLHQMFLFPKPIVAAINGHATAGGCLLALCADRRIMATGKPKIALNEVAIGATLFASAIGIIRYTLGTRATEQVVYEGRMHTAEEALKAGLVDSICSPEELGSRSLEEARELASRNPEAFASAKRMLRADVIKSVKDTDQATIKEFVEVWYSENTQQSLRAVITR